jgi:outer membrane protein OmpA-like peptidoglycan-associated protein
MRTAALLLIGVMLCATSGCGLGRRSAAAPTKDKIVLHGIVDFDKSTIRPDSVAVIEEAAAKLKEYGNLGVVVEGHSDSKGSTKHNQKLSLRRAEAVRDYLVKLGVAGGRIVVIGQGASEPIASNETREGRAQNRRVVLLVYQP